MGWWVVNLFHVHLPCFGGVGWGGAWCGGLRCGEVWYRLSVMGCDVVGSLIYFIWWGWVGLGDS